VRTTAAEEEKADERLKLQDAPLFDVPPCAKGRILPFQAFQQFPLSLFEPSAMKAGPDRS
jgi:hypothetical protein